MALSNIFREPRREITESAIGVAALIPFAVADIFFAPWFHEVTGGDAHGGCPVGLAYFVGAFALLAGCVVMILLALASHAIGEGICNSLARRGLELRPKVRR
jgi:hypothetical protein